MPNSRSNPFRLPPMSSQDSLGTWRFMRLWRGRSMCLVGSENSKFTRFSVSISVTVGDAIGNVSAAKLKEAKHSMVAKCKILVEKGKEVIGVDTKTESNGRYENLSAKEARGDGDKCRILVIHENSNIETTREKFQCLIPTEWLNEVTNLYLTLLKEKEQREPHKFLKCHVFNTFLYKKVEYPFT
ncbi:hypothetical protein JHK87_016279 [Glycine soja]|nr:hypothetical protein JHK87_016279 [Glycine soja]